MVAVSLKKKKKNVFFFFLFFFLFFFFKQKTAYEISLGLVGSEMCIRDRTYTAHITGITSFGLFVGLENGIEGLIHISYLTDDLYYFSEDSYTLQSRYGGKIYRLGEEVEVTLVRVNVEKGEIDFVLGKIDNIHDLERIIVQKEKKGKKRIKKKSRQTTHDSFHAITHTKNAHHINRHRRRKNGIHRRKKEWHKQK